MSGVLEGIDVLDLSTGIAGPMTGMLLADHGARVTKIEPPGGDPTRSFSGAQVWHRGKRSAVLDLHDAADHDRFLALAVACRRRARELRPGHHHRARDRRRHAATAATRASCTARSRRTATRAGTPDDRGSTRWSRRAPGTSGRAAGCPAARWLASPVSHLPSPTSSCPTTAGSPRRAPVRSSPACRGSSLASSYLATLAISAALRVREQTGRGQRVSTSLLQGVLATTLSAWQRVEHVETENFQSWISDPRAPKGVFRCADGRWIHQWVPLPDFVLSAAEGDHVQRTEKTTRPRDATTRIGMDVNEMLVLHHYQPLMAAAIAKFPAEPWIALGGRGRRAVAADPVPRGGAARRCARGRRLRHRGRRSRSSVRCARSAGCTSCTPARPRRPTAPPAIGADTDDGAGRSRRGRAAARR